MSQSATAVATKPSRRAKTVTGFSAEPESIAQEIASLALSINLTKGSLGALLDSAFPTGLKEQLKQARDYATGDNDLIESIVSTQRDFYAAGFNVTVAPPNKNYKGTMSERLKAVLETGRLLSSPDENRRRPGPTCPLSNVVDELVFDDCATSNSVLHWKVDGHNLVYVTTLAPHTVHYEIGAGYERLLVELSAATRNRINAAAAQGRKDDLKAFPAKYVQAAQRGDQYVELTHRDGEYWIVRSRGKMYDGLCPPTMRSIYRDLVLRGLIVGGDWAVAYCMKRLIEMVKSGEKVPPGYPGSLRDLYPSKEDIADLKKQFSKIGDAIRIYGNHTLSIEYAFPDPKVMGGEKFEKVEERILRWGGIPDVMLTGRGEGYSQGALGARRFVANGKKVRERIGAMVVEFLLHPSMQQVVGIPTGSVVTVRWDEQNLKDPAQVLREITAGWDRGILDQRTFLESLGFDYETVKQRKRLDHMDKAAEPELWTPLFEPSQGLLAQGGDEPVGRPQTRQTKTEQPPRPSTNGEKA